MEVNTVAKSTFEQIGGAYRQEDDYLLLNLAAPKLASIGIWGLWHLRYIKTHRKAIYTGPLLGGKLTEIDQQAEEMFSQLTDQIARGYYGETQSGRSDGMDETDELHPSPHKKNYLCRTDLLLRTGVLVNTSTPAF